jgi:hypothetical protein
MWTDIIKKLPKRNLVTNVFDDTQYSYDYGRYGEGSIRYTVDDKLVNMREWIKQMKATTTATYDAIIERAENPALADIVPISSLTPIIAPYYNDALRVVKRTSDEIKAKERSMEEEIPDFRDLVGLLENCHDEIKRFFNLMVKAVGDNVNPDYASNLFEGMTGYSRDFETARTINPKMKTSVSPRETDKLRFRTDTKDKVYYTILLDVDNINPQTNTRAFQRKSVNINFSYQHLPITLPPAVYDDISMGEEGKDYVQDKIINVLEGSVPLYVKRSLRRKIKEVLDKSKAPLVFGEDSGDDGTTIKLDSTTRQVVPYILQIGDFIEQFMQGDCLVQFEFSPDGNAPLNIIKMAVKDFYGMRTKSVLVNDSGEIASQEDITALEPERQRLTEEEQEQTGGGYYPALESYLDRTSDEERRRLEEYKYSIDTNMEGGKHITTILLNDKEVFRFGYQISGNEALGKLVSGLIRKELEAVEI